MSELVTLGETMVLFTPSGKLGGIKSSESLLKGIAGAETNVAIGVSRLGHSVSWISRVGKDPFGQEILYKLNGERVDTSRVLVDASAGTGVFFKERLRGDRFSVYYYRKNSAASLLSEKDVAESLIAEAKIVHLTGVTPALSNSCLNTVLHTIELAKKHSVIFSFDPNIRLKLWPIEKAREVLLPIIAKADLFFPGLEEGRLLLGNEQLEPDEVISAFLNMGIPQIILKLGPEGCITANSKERVFCEGFPVEEVDPVGAGDGFCAGYLAGILKGWNHEQCGRLATIVGALAVTQIGDYEGLPTWEEVEQILEKKSFVSR